MLSPGWVPPWLCCKRIVHNSTFTYTGGPYEDALGGMAQLTRNGYAMDGPGLGQQPRYGGTLRLALEGDPAFYDANQGPAPGGPAFWTGNNIWNSLLTITPPPELKIVPDLAKSWEVLDGGKTYVFHL